MPEVMHVVDYAGALPKSKHRCRRPETPEPLTWHATAKGWADQKLLWSQPMTERHEFGLLAGMPIRVIGQADLDANRRPDPNKALPEGLVPRGPELPWGSMSRRSWIRRHEPAHYGQGALRGTDHGRRALPAPWKGHHGGHESAEVNRAANLARYRRLREAFLDRYGRSCQCCASAENLTIDHVLKERKQHRARVGHGNSVSVYRDAVAEYRPDQYRTLCRSCNTNADRYDDNVCRLDHSARKAS